MWSPWQRAPASAPAGLPRPTRYLLSLALQQGWLTLVFVYARPSASPVVGWVWALQLAVICAALGGWSMYGPGRVWARRLGQVGALALGTLGVGGVLAAGWGAGILRGFYGQVGLAAAGLALGVCAILLPSFVALPWIQWHTLKESERCASLRCPEAGGPPRQSRPMRVALALALGLAASSLALLVVGIGSLVGLYGQGVAVALGLALLIALVALPYFDVLAWVVDGLRRLLAPANIQRALGMAKVFRGTRAQRTPASTQQTRPDAHAASAPGTAPARWLIPVTFFLALPLLGVAGWGAGRMQTVVPCTQMPSNNTAFAYLRGAATDPGAWRCDGATLAFVSLWRDGVLQARLGGGPGDVATQLAVLREKLAARTETSEAPQRGAAHRLALHLVRPRLPAQAPRMLVGFDLWLDPLRDGLIGVSDHGLALTPPEELVAVSAYDHGWDPGVPDVRIGLGLRQAAAHLQSQLAPATLKVWARARFDSLYEDESSDTTASASEPALAAEPGWPEACAASVRAAMQHVVHMARPEGLFDVQRHPLKEPPSPSGEVERGPGAPAQEVGSWARQAGVTWFLLHAGRSLADASALRAGGRSLQALLRARQPCGNIRCLRDANASYFDLGAQAILLLAVIEFARAESSGLIERDAAEETFPRVAEVAEARAELSAWLLDAATPNARQPFLHRWRVPKAQRSATRQRAASSAPAPRRVASSGGFSRDSVGQPGTSTLGERMESRASVGTGASRASDVPAEPMPLHLLYADGQAIMALANLGRDEPTGLFAPAAARAVDQVAALWSWSGRLLHFGELHWECLGVAELDAAGPPAGRRMCEAWLRQQMRWQLTDVPRPTPTDATPSSRMSRRWSASAPSATHLDGLIGYARYAPPILAMSATRGEALAAWLVECRACGDAALRAKWQPSLSRLLHGLVRFQLPGPYAGVTARPPGTEGAFPRATASLLSRNDMTQHAGHALLRGCGLALP